MDELTGLPLSFGKQSNQKQQFGNTQNIGKTKRTTSSTAVRSLLLSISTEESLIAREHFVQAIKGENEKEEGIIEQPHSAITSHKPELDVIEQDYTGDDEGDLPITHEVILSDHSKVFLFLLLPLSSTVLH